ncbi:MAG: hypothetical protein J7M14_05730 [Planctomycetes bacterium]|nr:hypothetical protein [Planctomycetota bacterium]
MTDGIHRILPFYCLHVKAKNTAGQIVVRHCGAGEEGAAVESIGKIVDIGVVPA